MEGLKRAKVGEREGEEPVLCAGIVSYLVWLDSGGERVVSDWGEGGVSNEGNKTSV